MKEEFQVITEKKAETAILVGIITQDQDERKTNEYLDELEFLLLADQQRHHLTELFRLQLSNELIDEALRTLMDEENIQQQDGFLLLG